MSAPTTDRTFHPVSISPQSFWAATAEDREATFRLLRDKAPISWHPPIEGALIPPEQPGVWAVATHADITYVSKHPELFTSAQGVMVEELPEELLEASMSFLAMDGKRHASLRRLVSAAFTPRQVKTITEQIQSQAERIVDDLLANPEGDFVMQVSKRLPMWTIYEMMGLDESHRDDAAHHADGLVSWNDPAVAAGREPGEVLNESLVALLTMALELAEARRAEPRDDLMTNLVQAEVDGEKLTDDEIAAFFVLLSVAGNDTTRNTISLVAKALQDNPAQRQLLVDDFDGTIGTAVDEFIRYATPVMTFRRTALVDTEVGGQPIRAGEWLLMLYPSANRDAEVFTDPERFDVTRSPNPHVGFGGGGPHFCMGAFLAKTQLRELFGQLLTRAPHMQLGEPEFLVGNFVHAVRSMPYTVRG
ncbi:cytochrome P450 [Williamsia phyllosphaerae]|uniref:Cytochrome P450 n=1 Tax=Williamsia phyllosphaerae TaxID=885042 RepID=A0ABQ1U2D2_9NOCA|nr:cytochrome P450 [Williamsia phyllosphaerae]GGF08739.1 cytochrome P450 [Williamsia phyllosphaerae]